MTAQRPSFVRRTVGGAVTALVLVAANTRSLKITLALSLLAGLAVPGTTLAGEERPVRGEFTISMTEATHECGADLPLAFAGSGVVSHLGRMTGSAAHCTEFGLFTEGVAIWDGVAVFVAADGSTITSNYSGWQDQPVGGVATVVTTHELVAGTGRFADVDGMWTLIGVIDFSAGASTGTFAGWISY
jgi:hypothetical protein